MVPEFKRPELDSKRDFPALRPQPAECSEAKHPLRYGDGIITAGYPTRR